jgi:nitroimidazol reductase NimA-like FMN-containing flavoprotein (pyridoxamine 5'-phosphate oxidase superfamily)
MATEGSTQRIVQATLEDSRYAVLATESRGQPHASLMAFGVIDGGRGLVFATYRSTRKHRNLESNPRVALLIDHRETAWLRTARRLALTAIGRVEAVPETDVDATRRILVARHPDLEGFVHDEDCVLMRLVVEWYQVAGGIDDIGWCSAETLGTGNTDA